MVIPSLPLALHIFSNYFFTSMLADGIDEIPFPPELPSPQFLFYLRRFDKHLPRSDALHRLYNPRRTIHRNRLHQKMRVVPIHSNLQKPNLPSLCNFQTHCRQHLVNSLAHHHPAIFRGTDNMIHQYGNIVLLVDVVTFHPSCSPCQKAEASFGVLNPTGINQIWQSMWLAAETRTLPE